MIEGIREIYNKICGFEPTEEQREIYEKIYQLKEGIPFVINLPCGCGKTEAVVIPFLSQAVNNRWLIAPRLIYVLPTRALCNQIKERIEKYVEKVKEINGIELNVGIEHGISSLDPLFFSDICITTFDQFLYGYVRSKHQIGRHFDLPAGTIANSIVVFDEAHLYSPYTHSLMRATIEIMLASNIPIILMTATIPATLEKDLFKPVKKLIKVDFSGKWPEHINQREIEWERKDWGLLNGEDISAELDKFLKANKDKRILIVVNRVDIAQALAKSLQKEEDFITLIHSRFIPKVRKEKEKEIVRCFGKDSKDNRKTGIIISTQVCEVGLDISCDILITECASADSLVQRVGRIARWGGRGKVIIVRPMEEATPIKDAQWGKAYPYVDKKKEKESEFKGIKEGEFAGIVWNYLENASKDLFTNWQETKNFCNKMKYHTDDIESRNALGQIFDSTLYADERPWNLSARGDLYCSLAIIRKDIISEGVKEEEKVKRQRTRKKVVQQIPYHKLQGYLINIPYKYLYSKDIRSFKIYDCSKGEIKDKLDKARPRPFQIYVVDSGKNYNDELGLTLDKKEKADETEEASLCMIL